MFCSVNEEVISVYTYTYLSLILEQAILIM